MLMLSFDALLIFDAAAAIADDADILLPLMPMLPCLFSFTPFRLC